MSPAQFGIGSPVPYSLQQIPSGFSPYGGQATGPYQSGASLLHPILQWLQIVTQQLQQLQQLDYFQQQQLQQLQQWIQVVPQQIQQLQQVIQFVPQQIQQLQQQLLAQQSLPGVAVPGLGGLGTQPFGVPGIPFQALPATPPLFTGQPGHVM
jgi:hypothetical protein